MATNVLGRVNTLHSSHVVVLDRIVVVDRFGIVVQLGIPNLICQS